MRISTHCFFEFTFNFLHSHDSADFKSIGNNTMKKMLLATALALLITGCAQQTFTVQNKPAAVAPEAITHHFFVSDWAKRNLSVSQNLWRPENIVKTETQQTFVNGLLGFNLFMLGEKILLTLKCCIQQCMVP